MSNEFECQVLKFILLKFGNHCQKPEYKVEVCGIKRKLCSHQIEQWHRLMKEGADKYFNKKQE